MTEGSPVNEIITTDDTPTTVDMFRLDPNGPSTVDAFGVKGFAILKNNGNNATGVLTLSCRGSSISGTYSVDHTFASTSDLDASLDGCTMDFTIDGIYLAVVVTGLASTTIDWSIRTDYVFGAN